MCHIQGAEDNITFRDNITSYLKRISFVENDTNVTIDQLFPLIMT